MVAAPYFTTTLACVLATCTGCCALFNTAARAMLKSLGPALLA